MRLVIFLNKIMYLIRSEFEVCHTNVIYEYELITILFLINK